jgi:uncharacterized protein YndB with AHSA1/START domain
MTDRNGRLTVDGDQAVLHFERKLPFPVEQVWAPITDPAHRDKWMGKTLHRTAARRPHHDRGLWSPVAA